MLGAAAKDKRYVQLNSGHMPAPISALVKVVTPWLDQYLGRVDFVSAN
jgi:hypothetical protein